MLGTNGDYLGAHQQLGALPATGPRTRTAPVHGEGGAPAPHPVSAPDSSRPLG
ncbi:MAG: hypothetical protein AVDCRST_MAG77-2881 [uncultured Chloroflexi bacterium]|uniref:Uncharacterized protein n=1 Tax=uncultured Chloroflexota bacterium TaxID=166587 RepID=A0A6J4J1A5_9CHLR|nr:MAG: hypothetical protein AVDCRST_MAG77-2881 [uncultured Chloroflexota bacterium]